MEQNNFTISEFKEKNQSLKTTLFISSSSFEERCFVVPSNLDFSIISKTIFICTTNEFIEIEQNCIELILKSNNKGIKVEVNSDNPIASFITIFNTIKGSLFENKPNVLLIDITTFTHEYLLMLQKILFMLKDQIDEVNFVYVGASEYSIGEVPEKKWLSKGVKEIRSVLGFPGVTDPTRKNHLIILFGFESERTKKIIEQYQYDYLSLGFADPEASIEDDHVKINVQRHKELLKEFNGAFEFGFSLKNPTEFKNKLLRYVKSMDGGNLNTIIAPMNNKISTIGAGLAALENTDIQLAYAKPIIYNSKFYSKPNETIYLYKYPLK